MSNAFIVCHISGSDTTLSGDQRRGTDIKKRKKERKTRDGNEFNETRRCGPMSGGERRDVQRGSKGRNKI